MVTEGIRPTIPTGVDVMPQYKSLMNQCWNGQSENRPSCKQVLYTWLISWEIHFWIYVQQPFKLW